MTQTIEQTNNLRFSTVKIRNGKSITVKIRLNDECKNGHQDFSITGDIYEAGKPKTDRYFISGGCIHEEIEKHFPEFKPFIALHLCDYEGIPMHAVANGFYHLRNGFNNTKPESNKFKTEFCEYYRVSPVQFDSLNKCLNELQYALALQNLGILAQWKEEANAAIKQLEQLTGKQFVTDSVKTQYYAPTPEAIAEEEEKQKSGFYSPESIQKREEAKQAEILAKLEAERDKDIEKATIEFEVKKQVLLIGGKKALDNCIFYNHTKQLAFNWKGYDRISEELITKIVESIQLPEGVTIENKNK